MHALYFLYTVKWYALLWQTEEELKRILDEKQQNQNGVVKKIDQIMFRLSDNTTIKQGEPEIDPNKDTPKWWYVVIPYLSAVNMYS